MTSLYTKVGNVQGIQLIFHSTDGDWRCPDIINMKLNLLNHIICSCVMMSLTVE